MSTPDRQQDSSLWGQRGSNGISTRTVLGWVLTIVATLALYLLSDIREVPVLKERVETQREAMRRLEAKVDALTTSVEQLPEKVRQEVRREFAERDRRTR